MIVTFKSKVSMDKILCWTLRAKGETTSSTSYDDDERRRRRTTKTNQALQGLAQGEGAWPAHLLLRTASKITVIISPVTSQRRRRRRRRGRIRSKPFGATDDPEGGTDAQISSAQINSHQIMLRWRRRFVAGVLNDARLRTGTGILMFSFRTAQTTAIRRRRPQCCGIIASL